MSYYAGQVCGIIGTVFGLLVPLQKNKGHMLFAVSMVNLFFSLNLLLIGEIGSGITTNCVAIVQTIVSYWHLKKGIPVTKIENLVFIVLYISLGLMGVHRGLDILPIIASLINMLATFQVDEQKTRILTLINCVVFGTYYALVGATAVVAQVLAFGTSVIGLIKYRKK